MPSDPIADAVKSYIRTRDAAAFERAMQQALARAHTAAYLRGLAERSAGGKIREFLARFVGWRALPAALRDELRRLLAAQLAYLRGFVAALPDLSDAQVAARAGMYGGPTRTTYSAARFPGLPFHPGEGSECKGQCKCSWADNGDGSYTWKLGAAEHCATCQTRASGSPYRPE